ncbi:MAG: DUF805 domain-containing protein [Pseudomonadota bacterium]
MNLLFGFQGRIGRLQWWLGQLALTIWLVVSFLVLVAVTGFSVGDFESLTDNQKAGVGASLLLFAIAALIPSIWINAATTVKRFHDRNKSGFWFFIIFVPYIGGLWQIVECGFLAGTPGGNDYGVRGGGNSARQMEYEDEQDFDLIDQMINQRREQTHAQPVVERDEPEPSRLVRKNTRPVFGKRGS